jgi:hypothetical protein
VRAAGVAKRALPAAEAELARAEAEVGRLEAEKAKRVAAVLAERANSIAAEYRRKFIEELVPLHDELAGIATALASLGLDGVRLVVEPLEIPRFALPALNTGAEYSPRMRRVSDQRLISRVAGAWLELGRRLAENPNAKLTVPANTTTSPVANQIRRAAATAAAVAAAVIG